MIKKYWQVFWFCRKIAVMKMMEYRTDFLFWALISGMWSLFNLLFYSLIISVNQNIAGWSLNEMYLLLGVFTVADAITWSFIYGCMRMYTEEVFSGEIIFSLLKPIDSQFFLMTRYNSFSNITRLVIGVVVLVAALRLNQAQLSLPQLIGFLVTFVAGLSFFYCLWFMASTLAFWVDKIDNINDAFGGIRSIFQVPYQVYTGIASMILTVFLPLGLIAAVPSEMLLGRGNITLAINLIIAAIIAFLASRWFFFYSIKRFSGVAN